MEAILLKQKRKQLSAFILGLLSLVAEPSANALETFKPYAGFDMQQRTVKMVPGFGEGLFNKRVPQGNIYAGFNFHEYFGIEIGQQFTQGSTRIALASEGNIFLGGSVRAGGFDVTESNFQMLGSHANITGRIPLPVANSHLILSAGAVALKIKSTVKFIASEFGAVYDETQNLAFSSRRVIPQMAGGLGFDITNNIRLRFLTGYEITSKFKNIHSKINQGFIMSFKNNIAVGLGVNAKF